MSTPEGFDLVVVGAGHAGCEAAAAAAGMGLRVALVTLDPWRMAVMPCNPAVGGVGKGHLTAEIDAMGGLQGWLTDRAGIHFRLLNRSRGPAVWGPRAQCDKALYSSLMGRVMGSLDGLSVVSGEVSRVALGDGGVRGVGLASGEVIRAPRVILTTGTFLGAVLHVGEVRRSGGRHGEPASVGLGEQLRSLGIEMRRFKTGTPPRLHRESVAFERLEVQHGDEHPRPFSWRSREVHNRACCWLTRTPPVVQQIIADNIHRSPLFNGRIVGMGPRYCPSIEDKVVRFPHHREHTLFLEPEGLGVDSVYVNGLSTSLPEDVQERVVRAIPGLEQARFLRYGYAVEYDVVAPLQVEPSLRLQSVPGLFLAGQVLGTSGYEEAAALGLMAGVNAAREHRGESELVLARDQAYVGVLVDDVVGRDHREPYRVFTSRAEHRLLLGVDSARERLMPVGVALGLVPEMAFHVEQERWHARHAAREALSEQRLNPDRETVELLRRVAGVELRAPTTSAQLLCRHDVDRELLAAHLAALRELRPEDREVVVAALRYEGYLVRHQRERERVARLAQVEIPSDLDLTRIPGLSREVVEQLRRFRPRTLAEAERVPGMTPAATAILAGRLARDSSRVSSGGG